MSDPWIDPTTDPYFRGEPTQQDYYANEYGQGFGNSGYDSPQDEVDARMAQAKRYFQMTGTYLPDHIPGIPDEVQRPEYDKPVFRSDFVSANQGDRALNEVYRMVSSGQWGMEEAISIAMQLAEDEGWAMPLETDLGDQRMTLNNVTGDWEMAPTVAQHEAKQAYLAANGILPDDRPPRKRGDNGMEIVDPEFPEFLAPRNFNETRFRENATKFVDESEQQKREQGDRDAAMAEYQDYIAPRYGFDFKGMMESGGSGGLRKTDYVAKDSGGGERYDNWATSAARRGTSDLPMVGRPASQGRPDSPSGFASTPRPQDGGNPNYARDSRAAQRTNEANRVSNEKFQAAYRSGLVEHAKENTLASKKDQRFSMMDQYLASIAYGGDQ